jgi:two-component system, OmpR family, phosphate regulon sensor histidine kinase PhoR
VLETLRGRLALTYSALTVIIVVALGIAIVSTVRAFYLDRLTDQLADEARLTAAAIAPTLDSSNSSGIDPLVKQLGSGLDGRVTVIATDGTVLGVSQGDPGVLPNQSSRPEVRQALAGTGGTVIGTAKSGSTLAVAVAVPGPPAVVVRIEAPLDDVNAAVSRVRRDIIGVGMSRRRWRSLSPAASPGHSMRSGATPPTSAPVISMSPRLPPPPARSVTSPARSTR